jgi:hypothetical protein
LQDGDLVHCGNIPGLMQKFGVEYNVNVWRLFIDSSKSSLKAVLEILELVITKIGYIAQDWMICGDLKVLVMLAGQQAGYTKYPCFMCERDSRARIQHWEQKH